MELKAKRAEARRVRRIYDNWKRLIQGMLIKHHVRETYGGDDSDQDDPSQANKKAKSKAKPAKPRKKIKQSDIDAQKSETKEKVQLGIDMNSDTVAMAKKSYRSSLSSRGMVHGNDASLAAIVPKEEDLILDSDEEVKETEEEKKERMRKILAWNDSKLESLADLSDDSGAEDTKPPNGKTKKTSFGDSRKMLSSDSSDDEHDKKKAKPAAKKTKQVADTKGRPKKATKSVARTQVKTAPASDGSEDEEDEEVAPKKKSRLSRRSVVKKSITYAESEEDDISVDESDLEDKTYKPDHVANKAVFAKAAQELMLSEESEWFLLCSS